MVNDEYTESQYIHHSNIHYYPFFFAKSAKPLT